MTTLKFHRWNAIFLGAFISLHFITHLSGVFGVDAYNKMQDLFRLVYRNSVVEPVLLSSFVLQIFWGILLLARRIHRGVRGRWAWGQVLSGGIFLLFISQHLIALVLARWAGDMDTNFYWPASVMSGYPSIWYFFPYYFLGVLSLFIHLGCAVRLVLMRRNYRQHAQFGFWTLTWAGVVIAIVINATLMGAFFEIELPQEWTIYRRE